MTKHFDIYFTVFLIHEWLKISLCLKMELVPLNSQMGHCIIESGGGEGLETFISTVSLAHKYPHSDDWVFFFTFTVK